MYNEEQKQYYINEKLKITKLDKYALPSIFEKTEPFEQKLDKDVSTFTSSEIENMYKTWNFASTSSIIVQNSLLSGYTNWCLTVLRNVPDSQNHFLEFSQERLGKLVSAYAKDAHFIAKDDLLKDIRLLINPSDKFLLLALFEGLKGEDFKEIWSLRESDIDVVKCEINVINRGKLKVSSKLCALGSESANTDEYISVGTGRVDKFIPSDLVIKERSNVTSDTDFRKGRRLYTTFTRLMKYLGNDELTANDVYFAGMVDFINRNAIKDGKNGIEWYKENKDAVNKYYKIPQNLSVPNFNRRFGKHLV